MQEPRNYTHGSCGMPTLSYSKYQLPHGRALMRFAIIAPLETSESQPKTKRGDAALRRGITYDHLLSFLQGSTQDLSAILVADAKSHNRGCRSACGAHDPYPSGACCR